MIGQTHCNNKWSLAILIVALIACFAGGFWTSTLLRQKKPDLGVVSVRVDNCTTVDTISQTSPIPASTEAVGEMVVKVPEASVEMQADSTVSGTVGDSAKVTLPIVQSIYEDKFYKAYVSGYNAKLDSIRLYHPTTTVTKTITEVAVRRLDWGVYASSEINLSLVGLKAGAFLDVPLTDNGRCMLEVRGGVEAIHLEQFKATPFLEVGVKYHFRR